MHPAFSVIFFTTSSGFGYGLLALLGLGAALSALPRDATFLLSGIIVSLVLITAGLLSSTLHLGHPERAWRALTQWRSSWLSREGVLAIVTYVPACAFAALCLLDAGTNTALVLVGFSSAVLALATVFTTSMIYASLRAIPEWHNRWVPVNYLLLALASGTLALNLLLTFFDRANIAHALAVSGAIALAALGKLMYWRSIDRGDSTTNAQTAVGAAAGAAVRLSQAPHTQRNYLQQEMGFQIARKHAAKLRALSAIAGGALPIVATLIALDGHRPIALGASLLAFFSFSLGLLIERWLFFAEAKHTVRHYYA